MCVLFAVLLVNVAVVGVEIFLEAPCLPLLPKLTHSSQHLVFSVEMSALSAASAEAVDATAVDCFYLGGWRLCEGHPCGTAGAHPSNNVGYCTRSLGSVVQSHLRWRGTRGSLLGRPAATPFATHSLQQERRGWKDRSTRPLTDLASYNARSDWCRTRHGHAPPPRSLVRVRSPGTTAPGSPQSRERFLQRATFCRACVIMHAGSLWFRAHTRSD